MENLVSADEFCIHHKIEITFIHSLHESGLIKIIMIEEKLFIDQDELDKLEKIIRLHYDLDINIPGIETISHLLDRVGDLQNEITLLKNRLGLYEDQ